MIQSKDDYLNFLEKDKQALYRTSKYPSIIDDIWKFERLLRKTEYYNNCRNDFLGRVYCIILKYRLNRYRIQLGLNIPINVCDKGLFIVHYGDITINSNAKIGKNCKIYNGVVIGSKGFGGVVPLLEIM